MKHAKLLQILIPILFLVFVQPVDSAGSAEQSRPIRTLLTERLVIMEQVAMFKWNEGLPINDKDREAIVLEKAIARAVAEGLVPKLATRVMTAQIAAAKAVQRELFRRWRAEGRGKHPEVPNLVAGLRPKISRLSSELIAALVAARNDLDGCLARHVLKSPPAELVQFPKAWVLAIDGALDALRPCDGQ